MKDITREWKKVPIENAKKANYLTEYEVNGVAYMVDSKCILHKNP